jgi:hypothetical protein
MVIISAGLGNLITNLIQNISPIEDILYCSNSNSLLDPYGYPNFNASSAKLFTSGGVKHLNIIRVFDLAGTGGPPGAGLLGANNPCECPCYESKVFVSVTSIACF